MERTAPVATGESVAFTYELAGLGSRFFAVFIDLVLQLATAALLVLLFLLLTRNVPESAHLTGAAEKFGSAVLRGVGVVAGFLLFFGYFIVFEWLWAGRTPGKRLLGIRVVRDGGFPLDFTSSAIRNIVRLLEFGFGFYVVSAVATLLSPRNRRLGDMAAGTIVVREGRFERAAALPVYDERRVEDPLISGLSPEQRALALRYVMRRESLSPEYRTRIAAQIAASVRPRLTTSFDHLGDDDLLVHLAATALAAR